MESRHYSKLRVLYIIGKPEYKEYMNAKIFLPLIVIALIVVGGIAFLSNTAKPISPIAPTTTPISISPTQSVTPTSSEGKMTNAAIKVVLEEQNNSSQSGTATIKEVDGKVMVSIHLINGSSIPQPAHFHTGTCSKPGPIKYPLTNVVNGKSDTTLNVSLADFKKELPLIVNVHKSANQINIYVACGEVAAQ